MNFARKLLLSSGFICLIENQASNALDVNRSTHQENVAQKTRGNKGNINEGSSHESLVNTQKNTIVPNSTSRARYSSSYPRQNNPHHQVTNSNNPVNSQNASSQTFSSTLQPLNGNQAPYINNQQLNTSQVLPPSNRSNNSAQQPIAPTQNVDLSKGWSNIYDIEFIYTPPVGFTGDPELKLCYEENKCIQMDTSYKVIIPKGTFKALPYQGDEHHNADGSVKGPASDGKGLTYTPITPLKPGIGISISCGIPKYQGGAALGDPTLRKIVFSPSQKEFLPFLQQEKGKVIDSVTEREVNNDGTSSMAPDPSNLNPVREFSSVHFVY